jgi:hypothetical protein
VQLGIGQLAGRSIGVLVRNDRDVHGALRRLWPDGGRKARTGRGRWWLSPQVAAGKRLWCGAVSRA